MKMKRRRPRKYQGKQKRDMRNNFFTVNELAKYVKVNPKTIYRRLWAKEIPAYKIGQQWRIAKKDIKWLRQ